MAYLLLSCSDAPLEQTNTEFTSALQQLNNAYGDDQKADFSGLEPCEILKPILDFGDEAIRSGFFVGAQGGGVLVGLATSGGVDIVWDYYHAQITVSKYTGGGINFTGGSNINTSIYAGWVTGFRHGVSEQRGGL